MARVAICIGVNNPGKLTPLRAAASGAEEFGAWLRDKQAFDVVKICTDQDADTPVRAHQVTDLVADLIGMGPQQLVIYFSGHGLLNGQSETWLLSKASQSPNEAVDLTASIEQSRFCGVPNVVFVSDACRSLPTNFSESFVRGVTLFPTPVVPPQDESEADAFLAAQRLGVALEVPVNEAKTIYKGLFTDLLLKSFVDPPEAITLKVTPDGADAPIIVVPNRKLRPVLKDRVLEEAEKFFPKKAQKPAIRLASGDTSYIGRAEFSPAPHTPSTPTEFETVISGGMPPQSPVDGDRGARRLRSRPRKPSPPTVPAPQVSLASRLDADVRNAGLNEAFRAQVSVDGTTGGFETHSGIELSGAEFRFAVATSGTFGKSEGRSDRARWHYQQARPGEPPPSVAVGFKGGGIIVTCLPEFVTSIIVDAGQVVNVSFVPARNGALWRKYQFQAEEVNRLRAQVATAVRFGQLNIDPDDASEFADTIRELKAFDPTLGLYAAYAYGEIGALEGILSVQRYMRRDIGADLYDVAMLASRADPLIAPVKPSKPVAPFCPMLSQGWSYAAAYGINWHPIIAAAAHRSSLWTTFDPESIDRIKAAITDGELNDASQARAGSRQRPRRQRRTAA